MSRPISQPLLRGLRGHTAAAAAGASRRRRGDAARALRRTARRCTGRAAADARSNCARRCRRWRSTPTTLLDALPHPAMAADVPLQADPRRPEAERWALALKRQCEAACRRGACTVHRARGGRRPVNGTKRPSPPGATSCCSCPSVSAPWPTWTSASSTTRARDLLSIGYNVDDRRRDAGHYDLLASEVRLGELRGDRQRPDPAGELVRARPSARHARRQDGAAVVERLDVRVPDADAGDAELREHAARRDHAGRRGAAGALRPPARRALGHLRIGLQHHRRRISTTSTARSACRGSDSSAVSPPTWWSRPTRR